MAVRPRVWLVIISVLPPAASIPMAQGYTTRLYGEQVAASLSPRSPREAQPRSPDIAVFGDWRAACGGAIVRRRPLPRVNGATVLGPVHHGCELLEGRSTSRLRVFKHMQVIQSCFGVSWPDSWPREHLQEEILKRKNVRPQNNEIQLWRWARTSRHPTLGSTLRDAWLRAGSCSPQFG